MAISHLQTSIAGLIENCTIKKLGLLFNMDGTKAKKELLSLQAKGHKYLPSEGCNHFDPLEGCQCRFYDDKGNKIK